VPGWAIADASFAAVLAFVLGVLFVLVRIVTGPGWRDRHKD
jgi:multisubunit Na+/H+ antiporter MnhF subunit